MAAEFTCPISKEPAKEAERSGEYTEISCPTCGPFRISSDAYDAVVNAEDLVRRAALANAKHRAADYNSIPTIVNEDLTIT